MKKTIMIVDDSILIRNEIGKILEGTDYEVVCQCRSGEEALETYEKIMPDIVTMDIILPGIDGLETSKRILNKHPKAGIVIISSLVYDKTLQVVKELGPAIPFVFKPINKSFFIESLKKVSTNSESTS
ncbi:chemotaxis protein CheY [Lacrimispora amygdalina]|uniref:Stage 0 sporulation protein A homolog n=1 Tax=Lacrimispora amygdalina TaxID=253257 RepID=A0A3E2NHB1_9FIRM|nr:response regulator [Clostridium indicum]RFZ80402.1 response regulator [Clostridium indicum]